MVHFSLLASMTLLATISSVVAGPLSSTKDAVLRPRQATLPPDCTEFCSPLAGCLCIQRPTNCVANYTVELGENCGTVVDRFANFTATELYLWNPEIRQDCTGLRAYVPVCIGVPGYEYIGPVTGGQLRTWRRTPVPVQHINDDCALWEYTDSKGVPTFGELLTSRKITQQQWNTWNFPELDPNDNLPVYAGYWSCVQLK